MDPMKTLMFLVPECPHRNLQIATSSVKRCASMVWSPSHGDTAFTVPLFDEFMRRTISGNDWME